MFGRYGAVIAVLLAMSSPALAQNVQGGAQATGSAKEPATGQATTDLKTPNQPSTAKTGVAPRGTKVAPSTNSAQGGGEKPQ